MTSRSKIIYFYVMLANQNSSFTCSTNRELCPVIAYTQKDTVLTFSYCSGNLYGEIQHKELLVKGMCFFTSLSI
jgi:hypothetical protein